ncbi:MAG TPA: glycosyltransferase family 39 protein, partial [Terriglobales bacterium]|nr:glycosyltransferase family 39 protein [Terriglobales bacterium]
MSQEPSPISAVPTCEDSPRGKSRQIVSISLILFFWLTIYAAGMFTPPLLDDVDTIHAEAAREMVLRHDWVT